MAKAKTKNINLAFQGGGAHGAVTWGVADRLLEDDRLEIDAISGSSAGAVNAAAVAYGLHKNGCEGARETLDRLWKSISDAGRYYSPVRANPFPISAGANDLVNAFSYRMFETVTRALSPYQFNPFDINPLRDILETCIDFKSLRTCKTTKLFIAATNVRSGKVHVFNTNDASTDVVCASACLPFLFKAVEIDGEHYWDGGYMGNPVLYPFFYEAKSSDIVIVHVNPIEREELPKTSSEIMNRVNEISFNSSLLRELRAISFVHKLLDDGWIKDEYRDRLRDIRIHSIRSDLALADFDISSKFRTDWAFLTKLKEQGREIANAWLDENFEMLGNESSVDLQQMFA
ncbi:patatin-like phospholipase family protein [Hyphococcus flavus]|uniref:Patatin-like phospholipase family protein n=1 Tax=Hyphococcus flavus TaxID=1866326 RepID=A0AAE9ZEK0_9PROT|nr:patatin-like phospholipase family protein [Hyphococcus flavus]WDI31202.1 patatin-like phospholipase family protein [Hyphococcus flavus]